MSIKCIQCYYQMTEISSKYYCCDIRQKVCIMCKKKKCDRCLKIRQLEYLPVRCSGCRRASRLDDESDLYYQHLCEYYFCSRCMSKAQLKEGKILLPCHHQCNELQYNTFMVNYCFLCGQNYDQILDYQLNDKKKLCYRCFRFERVYMEDKLLKCMSCNKIVRSQKQNFNNDKDGEFIICKFCYQQSTFEEKAFILYSNKKQTNANILPNSEKHNISQENSHASKNKIPNKLNQRQPQPQVSQIEKDIKNLQIIQPQVFVNNNNKVQPITSNQFYNQKINIKVQQQVQQQVQKHPIVDSFQQSQRQQIVQDVNYKPLKLLKYLSTETYVQNLKLQVQYIEDQNQVQCWMCSYYLPSAQSIKYAKYNQQEEYLCKLCYLQKNRNLLSFFNYPKVDVNLGDSRNRHSSKPKYKPSQENFNTLISKPLNQTNKLLRQNENNQKILTQKLPDKHIITSQTLHNHTKLFSKDYIPIRNLPKCEVCNKECNVLFTDYNKKRYCRECYYNKKVE